MASIPRETLNEIREAADLVAIIGTYVRLKKQGNDFFGLCPFHADGNASFSVSPHRHLWYCFGCKAGGDVYEFLIKIKGCSFGEAVEEAAELCGIPLVRNEEEERRHSLQQKMIAVNKAAAEFYALQLGRNQKAQAFAASRGLSPETLKEFGVGYAPDGWQMTGGFLRSRGFTEEETIKAGFCIPRTTGGTYDRFRDRLMFPVYDVDGHAIAFSGRTLGGDDAKWMNSPDTPVFDKSRVLYNLHMARKEIVSAGEAVLLEGCMDVVSASQAGVKNVVASLGTALQEKHLSALRRYTSMVVLAYDDDEAGHTAIEKAFPLLEVVGVNGRVALPPEGMDPDDFIQKRGVDAFRELIALSPPVIEFQLSGALQGIDVKSPEGASQGVAKAAPIIAKIQDKVKQSEYVRFFAAKLCPGQPQRLPVIEPLIWGEVRKLSSPVAPDLPIVAVGDPVEMDGIPRRLLDAERFLLQGILAGAMSPEPVKVMLQPEDFQCPEYRELAQVLWSSDGNPLHTEFKDEATRQRLLALSSRLLLDQDRTPARPEVLIDYLMALALHRMDTAIEELDAGVQASTDAKEQIRMAKQRQQMVMWRQEFIKNVHAGRLR